MGKSMIIGISTVAVLTLAAVPAALLSGGSNQPKPKVGSFIPQLTSASNIRDKYERVGCLKKYFKKILWEREDSQNTNREFIDVNDFARNHSTACLIIEYHKKTYENDKWKGEFRLVWAIKDNKNKQGFITVTNAKADGGNFRGSSAAYILKEDTEKETWNVSHIKEISQRGKDEESLKRLIPQKAESIPGSLGATDYWGFDPNLQNICGEKDCSRSKSKSTHRSYSWNFVGGNDGKPINPWNYNMKDWFEKIFGWDKFTEKMRGLRGTWTENKGLRRQ